jgi:hypothetical protein
VRAILGTATLPARVRAVAVAAGLEHLVGPSHGIDRRIARALQNECELGDALLVADPATTRDDGCERQLLVLLSFAEQLDAALAEAEAQLAAPQNNDPTAEEGIY